ncbi:unnamed protein product, partial [Hapterophycus canaliculatus]
FVAAVVGKSFGRGRLFLFCLCFFSAMVASWSSLLLFKHVQEGMTHSGLDRASSRPSCCIRGPRLSISLGWASGNPCFSAVCLHLLLHDLHCRSDFSLKNKKKLQLLKTLPTCWTRECVFAKREKRFSGTQFADW